MARCFSLLLSDVSSEERKVHLQSSGGGHQAGQSMDAGAVGSAALKQDGKKKVAHLLHQEEQICRIPV